MKLFFRLSIIFVALALVGGVVMLATAKIPPPSSSVERVIPNDRFPL